jgi:hypothetical protein
MSYMLISMEGVNVNVGGGTIRCRIGRSRRHH